MTDAYFVHDDNYAAMKEDRANCNGQKKTIREFNAYLEQKLAEAEDEVWEAEEAEKKHEVKID